MRKQIVFCSLLLIATQVPSQLRGQLNSTLRSDPKILRGASFDGQLLIFTPSRFQPGSSISHWDPSADPDLLMEPFIGNDRPFLEIDVSPAQMADIGWAAGNSTFNIIDMDDEGSGFTDPTPFLGAPGNAATTLGEARRNLVASVLEKWATTLSSTVDIDVLVSWKKLPCSSEGAVLGGASVASFFASDEGEFPRDHTWYPAALAEALAGEDLTGPPEEEEGGDILMIINSDVDKECLGPKTGFYYGLDDKKPEGRLDLASLILHELGHGLGMTTPTRNRDGAQLEGLPSIYDFFLFDVDLDRSWDEMTDAQRAFSATNERGVVWLGPKVTAQLPDTLKAGTSILNVELPDATALIRVTPASFAPEPTEIGTLGSLACPLDGLSLATSAFPNLPSATDGCQPLTDPAQAAGRLLIVDRGNCTFAVKAANAEAAGAAALIIANNGDGFLSLGAAPDFMSKIPVVGITRKDGNFLRSLVCPPEPNPTLVYGQWVDGEAGGQANTTRIVLRNAGNRLDTGRILFQDAEGNPSKILPAGEPSGLDYEIPPWGTFELTTPGTGKLLSGVIEVRSDLSQESAIEGTEIVSFLGHFLSLPNSPLRNTHALYVSVTEEENTGVAIYNPDPLRFAGVDISLFDSAGQRLDSRLVKIPPRGQFSGFVSEDILFGAFFANSRGEFKGSLQARTVLESNVGMVGVMLRSNGALIAVEASPKVLDPSQTP